MGATWVFRAALAVLVGSSAACARRPCGEPSGRDTSQVRLDVSLGLCNLPPKAQFGFEVRSYRKKVSVKLDASKSEDPNQDALSYLWTLSVKPPGSKATIDDPRAIVTAFTPDLTGSYEVELVASDGELDSAPLKLDVLAKNTAPIANAGPDMLSPLGTAAVLDGTASSDPDNDALTYQWRIKRAPAGSTAVLNDPTSPHPTITPDIKGPYVLGLIVNDGEVSSTEDIVRIGGGITGGPPTANAGVDQNGVIGVPVTLDGTASFDDEGAPLEYLWTLKSQPPAALPSALSNLGAAAPSFVPTREGTYVFTLVVNDGFFESQPDDVSVVVIAGTGLDGGPCIPNGCMHRSVCQSDKCVHRPGCGMKTEAGGDLPETHTFDMDQVSGTFNFLYNTYSIQDQMDVVYESKVLFTTGCVGAAGMTSINFSGLTTIVTVNVTPNCAGPGAGTVWDFEVDCPN